MSGDTARQLFARALDVAVAELATRPDVVALLYFGSAARGEATPGSDLDFYAVTTHEATGNAGRTVEGVPIEISFASLAQWTTLVRAERPTVVHAFATGRLVLDRTEDGLEPIRQEARALWARGPSALTPSALLRFRFHLTDFVRDLDEMPEHSAATALMAGAAVRLSLEAQCARDRVWMPTLRQAITVLRARYPDPIARIEQCAEAGFPRSMTRDIVTSVLHELGGELHSYDTSLVASR